MATVHLECLVWLMCSFSMSDLVSLLPRSDEYEVTLNLLHILDMVLNITEWWRNTLNTTEFSFFGYC